MRVFAAASGELLCRKRLCERQTPECGSRYVRFVIKAHDLNSLVSACDDIRMEREEGCLVVVVVIAGSPVPNVT